MKWRKGPRPWTVHVFGAALMISALITLFEALATHPALLMARWYDRIPIVDWVPDLAIIASFTAFTIAMIPLVWIYFFGSTQARWIVLVFGLLKIALSVRALSEPVQMKAPAIVIVETTLVLFALAMLFLPSTNRWLQKTGGHGVEAFD